VRRPCPPPPRCARSTGRSAWHGFLSRHVVTENSRMDLTLQAAAEGGGGDEWDYSGSDESSSEEEVERKPKDATEGHIETVCDLRPLSALSLASAPPALS
jgi:hypothetical protein